MPSRRHTTVEECEAISAHDLVNRARAGEIGAGIRLDLHPSGGGVLWYHGRGVGLVTTRPRFGGVRYWFRCGCGRVVAHLYRPPGVGGFHCRSCHRLTYQSCQERRSFAERMDRAMSAKLCCSTRTYRQAMSLNRNRFQKPG